MTLPRTRTESLLLEQNPFANYLAMSYLGIRRSIGLLGLILPVVLGPIGLWIFGIEIQENMSSYYHTGLRDIFVGVMVAMGIFLYCYHGYDWFENWTGNLACASCFGVALCPLDANSDPLYQKTVAGYLHTLSGGVFFTSLALYSLYHFPRGHFGLRLRTRDEQRDGIYFASGVTILGSMFLMGLHLFVVPQTWKDFLNSWNFLFWMEWVAVWAFAIAWLTKGHALLADIETPEAAMQSVNGNAQ